MFHRYSTNYIGQMPSVSNFLKLLLLPLLALLFGAGGVFGQTTIIAEWNFDTQVRTPTTASANNTNKTVDVVGASGYTYVTGASSSALAAITWGGNLSTEKFWQIEISTLGFENLTLSSAQYSQSQGPRDFVVEYSTDGSSWTPVSGVGTVTLAANWTSGEVSSVSLDASLDDQPIVYLRWKKSSTFGVGLPPVISNPKYSAIDDILIEGSLIGTSPTVSISSFSPPAADAFQGSANNVLIRYDLSVSVRNTTPTGLTVPMSGTYNVSSDFDPGAFKLWQSVDDQFDALADQLLASEDAVSSGADLIFTGFSANQITAGSTGYFFVTFDVAAGAEKGNTVIAGEITSTNNFLFNPSADKTGTSLPVSGSNTQTINCFDTDSEVYDNGYNPTQPTISSLDNDAGSAVQILDLLFFDPGTCVGLSTIVTNLRLVPGLTNAADWSDHVGGVVLVEVGGDTVVTDPPIITDTYIDIPIPSGNMVIADGGFPSYTLSVFLNASNQLIDNSVLSFMIDGDNHGFATDPAGSGFTSSFSGGDIVSNDFTVDVQASELAFVEQPQNSDSNVPMASDVSVEARDIHGNIDTDFDGSVSMSSSGTMTGDPLSVSAVAGTATWRSSEPAEQIVHTAGGTGLALTASATGLTDGTSELFDIIQTADRLVFVGVPASGQQDVTLAAFTVEAQKPDGSVDDQYTGDVTLSLSSGPGNISGTLVRTLVNGVATFDDISFTAEGNYVLAANLPPLTEGLSSNIAIVGADVSVFPNGRETMNVAASSPSTIAAHDGANGFVNTGALTFSAGGAANEADIRNTSISDYGIDASGGSNVFFTSITGDYGFAIEDINASPFTNLMLQFAVRKETGPTGDFASLAVEYWDGDSWEAITITDFPAQGEGAGWYLLSPVALPAAAEIADLDIRWVKTGNIACRVDDITLTGTPKAAANLIVATINGGVPPVVNAPFTVDVQVQDGSGSAANVLDDTDIQLSVDTGTGTLGGTLTGTIPAGTSALQISNLTYDVSESGVSISASRTSGDNLASGSSDPFGVLPVEPTTSATALVIDSRSTSSISLSWTNGDGDERVVVAKADAPVDEDPVDGVGYAANSDFALGEDIGNGNIVVYAGNGNAVTVTNLAGNNTEYYFAVYEYNGQSGLQNYRQTAPATGSALTTCDAPLTQASNITFPDTRANTLTISWDVGDGDGQVVVMNASNTFTTPSSPPPAANPVWQNSGQQVLYIGDGSTTTVDISGLSGGTTYWFRVYEINCAGADMVYNETDNAISEQTGLFYQDFTSCPPAGWLNVTISGDQSWSCDASGYASISGIGSSAASQNWYITPSIDFDLIADEKLKFDTWTSGTDDVHPKLYAMYSTDYSGSGNPYVATWDTLVYNLPLENSQAWTGSGAVDLSMVSGSAYLAFQYSATGTVAGAATEWRIDNVQINAQACVEPTQATSNLNFSDLEQTTMTLNFDKGDGIGRMIVAGVNTLTFTPDNGVEYMANSNYSEGTDLGNGDKIVYVGGGNSAKVEGLSPGTLYYFAIYEFTCNGTNRAYGGTALTGQQSSLTPTGSDIIVTSGYTYTRDIYYLQFDLLNTLTQGETVGMVGLTLRDEGYIDSNNSDGQPTELTSITFSTNGSTAIRAAALFLTNGTKIKEKLINGATSFQIDIVSGVDPQLKANSNDSVDFELRVTFEDGVTDNEQIVFTVIGAEANPTTSLFKDPDAGGAESINTGGAENTIRVVADSNRPGASLNIIQGPSFSVPIEEDFVLEVEATDSRGSRDLDKTLTVSRIQGSGNLTSTSSLSKATATGTALWTDLEYDKEEQTVEFQISDGQTTPLTVSTGTLKAKPRFTIFTFTGNSGDEATAAADIDPLNVTISVISRGSGISAAPLADAFSARNWPAVQEADSYYEFTVTANPGFRINISSIEFDHRRSSSTSGPTDWVLENSVYATPITGSVAGDGDWNRNTEADLSIVGENTATFQLFAYGASNGNATWALDNIEIFGTVVDADLPSFTTGFPQSDSTAVDGFDLLVNLNKAATAHYVIQPGGGAVPSVSEVKAGQSAEGGTPAAAGTIDVTSATTDFTERIGGLNAASVYDVYYVLSDDTNDSDVIEQADLPTSDINTDLVAATQPVGPFEIPSTSIDAGSAVNVFNFQISDQATADGAPTHVTQLVFYPGSNNEADWATVIGGVTLFNVTEGMYVDISNIAISPAPTPSIIITIDQGNLTINNGETEELGLSILLTGTVTDNEQLEFMIGGNPHSNTTYTIGSQFNSTLTALTSNVYTINVSADRLFFETVPLTVANDNEVFSVTVHATDANGNLDMDETSTIDLSRGIGTGILSNATSLSKALIGGIVIWDDLQYDGPQGQGEIFNLLATDNAAILTQASSAPIQFGSSTDLIVTAGNNVTITGVQSYNNVTVEDNGTLTIATNATLNISGDLSIDGANGVFNDLGGTTSFTGNNRQRIQSDLPSKTISIYNLDIVNSSSQGVEIEVNINLINTLKLNLDANIDVDGNANDMNFTLVSTSTSTARIGAIGDGATINGEVTWQRSLRTGPAGFRYIGTPIKGQTLDNIRDDVWIQGVAESYPDAYTNIATFSEPLGTNGQNGYEGWQDFTSYANPLEVGKGMKLWLWSQDYETEQVIQNSGAPTIGSGDDGTAVSGEAITFNASFTPTAYDGGGWNFFANPYPCELDWDLVKINGDINGKAVHVWNPTMRNYGTYHPETGQSTNGGTRYIASGQGFFVKADAAGASVEISEDSKVDADGNSFLRRADGPMAKLMVGIETSTGIRDEAAIAFTEFASDGYDPTYDADKFSAGWINISSLVDEQVVTINAMGPKRGVQMVKLNIEPYVFGACTLSFYEMEDFEEGAQVHLLDHYLGRSTVISNGANYPFSIDEDVVETYGDRFEIQFVEQVGLRLQAEDVRAGREIVVPVIADKLADVLSAGMSISWDSDALTFVGVEDAGIGDMADFDLAEVEEGRLGYYHEEASAIELTDGTQLFSMRFRALNGVRQAAIRFDGPQTELVAINDIAMPFTTENTTINILQNSLVSGGVLTSTGAIVNEVIIQAENDDEVLRDQSNASGNYTLETLEQSTYAISGQKADDAPLTESLTTLDIIHARQHILGQQQFESPYQWIAADVNGSGSVTAFDLVEMRKVILGLYTVFPSGLNWLIIPDVFDLQQDPFAYSTTTEIALGTEDEDLDFVAVKVGDVDQSWINQEGGRLSVGSLDLLLAEISLNQDLVEIPVIVDESVSLRGYQFSMVWNPTELEYVGVSSKGVDGHFNDQLAADGILTTLWDESGGSALNLEAGQELFTVKFRARHEQADTEVQINSALTKAMAFGSDFKAFSIRSKPLRVSMEALRNGNLEVFQNVPNPFDFSTQIDFRIPKSGLVRLTVVNSVGKIVYMYEDQYEPGLHSISWDRSQSALPVTEGLYLYRLECNGEEVVKKMLVR
jgi:hypothetical protein